MSEGGSSKGRRSWAEPFRIEVVETITMATRCHREAAMARADWKLDA